MKRRSSSLGAKKTSTPLNNNRGFVPLKSFSSISTIQNDRKGIRHQVIESPFEFESPSKCSTNTETRKQFCKPSKKLTRRRPDTPIKSTRSSQFSHASIARPLKLRFSEVSSSSVNSKVSEIVRRCSATSNKHQLHTDENPECKNAAKIRPSKTKNCFPHFRLSSNTGHDNDSVADMATEKCSEGNFWGGTIDSDNMLPKKERLSERESVEKCAILEDTFNDFSEEFESIVDNSETELLDTSDAIESCRRESISSIVSGTAYYFSDSDVFKDDYISICLEELNKKSNEISDDIVCRDNIKCSLEKDLCVTSDKNSTYFMKEILPEINVPDANVEDFVHRECEKTKIVTFNAMHPKKYDHSNVQDDTAGKKRNENVDESSVKVKDIVCNLSSSYHEKIVTDEEPSKEKKEALKTSVKNKTKQEIKVGDLEKNVYMLSESLNSADKVDINSTDNKIHLSAETKIERKVIERKIEAGTKPRAKYRRKVTNISNNIENKTDSLVGSQPKLSKNFDNEAIEISRSSSRSENTEKTTIEKNKTGKKYRRKRKGNRKKQKKSVENIQSLGSLGEKIPDVYNIRHDLGIEFAEEFRPFQKSVTIEKKTAKSNASSNRNLALMKKKTKNMTSYPFSSTPFVSPACGNEKLPPVFQSLSPVLSNVKEYSLLKTKIKAKKTYTKTAKTYPKSDKDISKWESFLKKPSYHKIRNNYVNESNLLKSRSSIHLFKSPPIKFDEKVPIDDILKGWDKSRGRKTSRKTACKSKASREKEGHELENASNTEEDNNKKWFETTKLKNLASHFNEISEISLVIENKNKNKRRKKKARKN